MGRQVVKSPPILISAGAAVNLKIVIHQEPNTLQNSSIFYSNGSQVFNIEKKISKEFF